MDTIADSLLTFLGTCVVLAWAIHELVHLHEVSLDPAPEA